MAQVRAELTPVEAGRFVVYGSHDRERIAAEPHRPRDRGGAGLRHRAPRHDPGLPDRARPAGRGAGWWRGGSPTSAAGPACSRWRRPRSGRRRRSPATSTRWRPRPRGRTSRRTASAGRVACVTAAGFRHPRLRAGAPYDLIFANILAGPLRRLAPELAAHHAPGGVAILSGILARQAAGVTAVYRSWGYRPRETVRIGEWATLVLRRPRPDAVSARARSSATRGDLAAVQADVERAAGRTGRAAPSRCARALRQAAKASSARSDERDDAEGGDGPERDARVASVTRTCPLSFPWCPGRRIRPSRASDISCRRRDRAQSRFLHSRHAFPASTLTSACRTWRLADVLASC